MRRTKRRGRPKLRLGLRTGDRALLRKISSDTGCSKRERLVARSLLLAATGEHTHHEIATAIKVDNSRVDPDDIVDLQRVLRRLQQHRVPAVSAIWQRLTSATKTAILSSGNGASKLERLKAALATDLTALVHAGRIFDKSHFVFIGGAEELEGGLIAGMPGPRLRNFNRRFIAKVLDGAIRDESLASATVSQIQTWISRYRSGGLDEVLIKRHLRPRGDLASLELMVWLVAGVESGNVQEPKDVIRWVHRHTRNCRLKLSTAERHIRNWRRLRSLPMAKRMKTFLVNSGFVHRFATVQHERVVSALQQLRSGMISLINI